VELIKIFRDHGPAKLVPNAGSPFGRKMGNFQTTAELTWRMIMNSHFREGTCASSHHADHLGPTSQKQAGLVAVGLCVPIGRVNPDSWTSLRVSQTFMATHDSPDYRDRMQSFPMFLLIA